MTRREKVRASATRRRPTVRVRVVEESGAAATRADVDGVVISRREGSRARSGKRALMCGIIFATAFTAMAGRLGVVAFAAPDTVKGRIAAAAADRARPDIVDRNGVLLASDLPMRTLEIAGAEVWSAAETAAAVAAVFPDTDVAALDADLRAGRYREVRRGVTPAQERAIFSLGLPGVYFSDRVRRYYPQAALAAHVIGHGAPGLGGVMGLEKALNERAGDAPLVASIDIRAQQALEEELAAGVERFHAKAAWGAVMDVETGEILALASAPDFDPNDPGAAPADNRRNRVTYDRYELGSAFKIFTAAAALETGAATSRSTYDARGSFKVADRVIRDFHGENRVLTFSEVVRYSSNIGMARMAADLGAARQKEALGRLGLLDPLALEIAEGRDPEPPKRWGPVESATISYGHGISVTPLHLLAATAAVVNGGVFRMPTFLKAESAAAGDAVFSERTSADMRAVLREVVIDGTASKADVAGYAVIGKTATAEKPRAGGYDRSARLSTFVGAFPGLAPRYAVLISYDEPQPVEGTYGYATAGWNAAPTFAAVTARIAPMLGVLPTDDPVADSASPGPAERQALLDIPSAD